MIDEQDIDIEIQPLYDKDQNELAQTGKKQIDAVWIRCSGFRNATSGLCQVWVLAAI